MQRWVYEQGWTSLHDAQERAIEPILAGNRDVIIAAATAAGKTEAAFLPICSAVAKESDASPGVDVLYLSPLKALINDQFDRLEEICGRARVSVHRWHGDVGAGAKRRVLDAPGGVLLITPESLEALFVNRGTHVARTFAALRYVVVDELHSFMGAPRGAQLVSLMNRVELAIRRRPPRIGLSATLGDMTAAAAFLRPAGADSVIVIASASDGRELKLQVRGLRATSAELSRAEAAAAQVDGERVDPERTLGGDTIAVADHLFRSLRGSDNLVFANSRREVELYADLLARRSERERVPNEFSPHHGSLAKDVREVVESQLKDRTRPVTAICTSTLELGIDIGSVTSIAQLGSPPSVAALRQRLGRSGRRDEPAILRIYVSEPALDSRSSPIDQLRCELVQTVAMVRLLLSRWFEAPRAAGLNLSTLTQQTLSLIAQYGGVGPADAHRVLCGPGPFQDVDSGLYARLLRALADADLISQASDGTLLHGSLGERLVNHYSFYAAFETPEEWRLVAEGRSLGSMPIDQAITVGGLLLFAGRRWRISSIEQSRKVIELTPAAGGVPPVFGGSGFTVADRVRSEMVAVYEASDTPAYLDRTGADLLTEARDGWRRLGLSDNPVLAWGVDTLILPWVGDPTLTTIALALRMRGLDADREGPAVLIRDTEPEHVLAHVGALLDPPPPEPVALARLVENREHDKWDWALDPEISAEAYAARALDCDCAWETLRGVAGGGSGRAAVRAPATGGSPPARLAARRAEFCVIDVETTGFSPRLGDRIIELAAVRTTGDGQVLDEWTTLVNPARDIGATSVHGIAAGDVLDAPTFTEVAGDLLVSLQGAVVVAHNHRFDWEFLVAEFAHAGYDLPPLPGICTITLATRFGAEGAERRLSACCAALGIDLPDSHNALGDARATAKLLAAYVELAGSDGEATLKTLGCRPLRWPAELPEIAPSGRRRLRGTAHHVDEEGSYMRSLVEGLDPVGNSDANVAAYYDLLDRALADRRLTSREATELAATAQAWGLSAETVSAAHSAYYAALVEAALADDRITDSERGDLDRVRRLLCLEPSALDEALPTAAPRPTPIPAHANRLAGLSVCFTGALRCTLDGQPITRVCAEQLAASAGLEVRSRVTKDLDLLVVADPDTQSGKARQARRHGTRILAEPVFWSELGVPAS